MVYRNYYHLRVILKNNGGGGVISGYRSNRGYSKKKLFIDQKTDQPCHISSVYLIKVVFKDHLDKE